MTVRNMNLVAPLSHTDTDMHATDTAERRSGRSGAVSSPKIRRGDVNSANRRLSTRTSTTATRTTTTCLRSAESEPSADSSNYSLELLLCAYLDCRRNKRNTGSALTFEQDVERNLWELHQELIDGSYRPGRSICFVITRPKPREVWAAEFRDRIVHHLIYNFLAPRFLKSFIVDSCACIPERGTLYAARRLEAKIRSASENWSKPVWYLKCDLANFFVSIDKHMVWAQLQERIAEPWWKWITHTVLFHDPRENFEYRGAPSLLEKVPAHKRLTSQPAHLGLPIGNLSSQFFANVHLDALDQFVKHRIGARHYVRYVDDFVLLHESPQWLNAALAQINEFLPSKLHAQLNPKKTILQPVARGVDFVGQVIKPWHTHTRRRTFNEALTRIRSAASEEIHQSANSYFGLMRQSTASHTDRARLAKLLLQRGHTVNKQFTKTFRKRSFIENSLVQAKAQ